MSRLLPAALAAGLLALPACSPAPEAAVDPCSLRQGTQVPEGCEPQDVTSPTPAPSPPASSPAEGSAAYDALVVGPEPGELARAGNDVDAEQTGAVLDVVVPAGARLRTRVVCEGLTTVELRTEPDSGAASSTACGRDGVPAELIVEDPAAVPAATPYRVVVTAPAPARWYVVVAAA